jgi:hydrogenase maturation protein HypF
VRVRGIVQGVGFRPAVYRLAAERDLAGWIRNDAEGVLMELEGAEEAVDGLLAALRAAPPPLAQIAGIETEPVPPVGERDFRIVPSAGGERSALVSPDMSICPDCARELLDPADRRFRYPFINCTNCGPRYSIIRDIPYDRPNTTMRDFVMCPACRAEYDDPTDRRFHAQPNACPACGPKLDLRDADGRPIEAADPVRAVREALLGGRIVAVKGLTGFHLAADARSDAAVAELRRRKGRDQKPFALMAGGVEAVRRRTLLEKAAAALLASPERPIVLLPKRTGHDLSASVAPASPYFGFMLPYAPIHLLLFEDLPGEASGEGEREFPPLVMTSGNLSEEPICREDEEAIERLAGIADLYLLHDRPIHTVCDDSVATLQRGGPLLLRRGRGYAPRPLPLPIESPEPILAVGPELKNAVCLVRGSDAFVSQHVGDLKNALAARYFEATVEKLERLLEVDPTVVAHDLHPAYASTRYARRLEGVRLVGVQHHHAHVASVMAEHGLEGEVIGLAMDGTGYGTDGTVWGGEVLRADAAGFARLGHLAYVPLPGGDAAVEHPVRTAWAALLEAFGGEEEAGRHLVGHLAETDAADRRLWAEMIERGVSAPQACGLGRLFDAASALAGVCGRSTYEGQAAIELEAAAAGQPDEAPAYEFALRDAPDRDERAGWVLDWAPLVRDLVADLEGGTGAAEASARFHATVAAMLLAAARRAREESGLERVTLSGGCFANARLVEAIVPALEADGFTVYAHRDVPPGDGGVALGQAYVAAATRRAESADR